MNRRSLALLDMLGWFSRVDRVECEALLVGCELEADEDAESGAVTSVEWGSEPVPLAIGLAGGRCVLFPKVARDASFTDARPGWPLLTAFAAARTATERAADEDRGMRNDVPSRVRVSKQDDRRCRCLGLWTPLKVAARGVSFRVIRKSGPLEAEPCCTISKA